MIRKLIELGIYAVNLLMVFFLITSYAEGNDKAIFLLILGYPLLIGLDFIIGGILTLFKRKEKKYFFRAGTLLAILFIPFIFIVPFWG